MKNPWHVPHIPRINFPKKKKNYVYELKKLVARFRVIHEFPKDISAIRFVRSNLSQKIPFHPCRLMELQPLQHQPILKLVKSRYAPRL